MYSAADETVAQLDALQAADQARQVEFREKPRW
jgi:hypothetical protein